MGKYEDEDGIDGPFNRAIARASRTDGLAARARKRRALDILAKLNGQPTPVPEGVNVAALPPIPALRLPVLTRFNPRGLKRTAGLLHQRFGLSWEYAAPYRALAKGGQS